MGATRNEHRERVVAVGAVERCGGVLSIRMGRRFAASVVGELVRILSRYADSLAPDEPLRAVVDLERAPFTPSGQEMRYGALRLAALTGAEVRIALIAADDFQFGLGRMLGLLSEDVGLDIRPFRDSDSAWSWIEGVDTPNPGA